MSSFQWPHPSLKIVKLGHMRIALTVLSISSLRALYQEPGYKASPSHGTVGWDETPGFGGMHLCGTPLESHRQSRSSHGTVGWDETPGFGGMSKVATDYLRVFIECQSNYYIHANSWIVQ